MTWTKSSRPPLTTPSSLATVRVDLQVGRKAACRRRTAVSSPTTSASDARTKNYKQLRITCQADDTYLGGHHSFIYKAFSETRVDQRETCTLESNESKLKAFSVNHGVSNVPQYILDAQGGHITGFKCVSAFVGPDTEEGTAWKIEMLTKTFEKKLKYLDALDVMPKHVAGDKQTLGLRN
jgi:hypothetical protein